MNKRVSIECPYCRKKVLLSINRQCPYCKNIVPDGQTKAWQHGFVVQPIASIANGFKQQSIDDEE